MVVALAGSPNRRFRVAWGSHVFAHDLDIDDPEVYVMPNLRADGEVHLVATSRAVPLADFVAALPAPALERAPRAAGAERPPRAETTVEAEARPWLRKFLKRKADAAEDSDEGGALAMKPEGEPLVGDEVDAVFAALEAKRLERACHADPSSDAFATRVLGGKWTAENLGLVASCTEPRQRRALISRGTVRPFALL